MLLRGAAVALATLAVAAFAFAARADAETVAIYWANANTHTIGFATGDPVIVDNNFIHVAGGFPNGVAVYGDFVYWTVPDANAIGRAGMNGTDVDQTFMPTDLPRAESRDPCFARACASRLCPRFRPCCGRGPPVSTGVRLTAALPGGS